MSEVSSKRTVTRSADAVWKQISDFADLSWAAPGAPVEVTGTGVGAERKITIEGGVIHERLKAFDDAGRSFSYTMLSGPMPLTNYVATVSVSPEGDGCSVQWAATFEAPAAALDEVSKGLQGMFDGALGGL